MKTLRFDIYRFMPYDNLQSSHSNVKRKNYSVIENKQRDDVSSVQ